MVMEQMFITPGFPPSQYLPSPHPSWSLPEHLKWGLDGDMPTFPRAKESPKHSDQTDSLQQGVRPRARPGRRNSPAVAIPGKSGIPSQSQHVLPECIYSPHFTEVPEARAQWDPWSPSPCLRLQRREDWNSCHKIQK